MAFVLLVWLWAIATGIIRIIEAIQLRKEIENEWALILGGIISVIFGIIVLIAPGAGALALVWWIAIYSIVFGVMFIAFALRLRRHQHHAAPPATP